MRTKITTLIATCCVAALALTVASPTVACDQDKNVVKTAGAGAACCPGPAAAAVAGAKSGQSGCAVERSAKHLMAAFQKMDGCCGEKCPGRADMVLAVQSIASVKEGLVCEKLLARLGAEPAVLSVRNGDDAGGCASAQAKGVANVVSKGSACGGSDLARATSLLRGKTGTCGNTEPAKAVVASNSEGSACGSKDAAKAATLVVSKSEGSACGSKDAAKAATLVVSKSGGSACGSKDAAKAATLVVSKSEGSACGSKDAAKAATLVVSKSEGSACGSKDAAKAATLVVSKGEGSSCSASKKTAEAKLVADAGSTCSGKDADARYIAFGCDKSDRIARAAAQAYLAVMSELKATSGAEGCSYSAASEVLASLLEDRRNEAQAAAVLETVIATNE